jgi:hypothetical protein
LTSSKLNVSLSPNLTTSDRYKSRGLCIIAIFQEYQMLTRSFIPAARPSNLRTADPIIRKMTSASAPGENFEVRQISATEDWHPDRKFSSDE